MFCRGAGIARAGDHGGGRIAGVALAVVVGVCLVGVRDGWAVVSGVRVAVVVVVRVVGVAASRVVGVRLVGVVDAGAVVVLVGDAVAVRVRCVGDIVAARRRADDVLAHQRHVAVEQRRLLE